MNYSRHENDKRRLRMNPHKSQVLNKVYLLAIRAFIAVLIIGSVSVAAAGLGAYTSIIDDTPEFDMSQSINESFTTIVYLDSTGEEIDRYDSGENREYAPLAEMPENLKNAFISIEDERFYTHNGIDLQSIVRVGKTFLESGEAAGASTITQQLIKNKRGLLRNSPISKIQEQYMAIKYEEDLVESLGTKMAAKDHIIELYLNSIGLGEGQVGVKAAALFYFDKNPADLTIAECAVLAAITQRPIYYSPVRNPDYNKERQTIILKYMYEQGLISEKEYTSATAEKVYDNIKAVNQEYNSQPSYHSYFNDAVFNSVQTDLMNKYKMNKQEASNYIYNGGLSIYTTQDIAIQEIVDKEYLNEENFPDHEYAIAVEYIVTIQNNVTGKQEHFLKKETVKTLEEAEAYVESVKSQLTGMEKVVAAERIYYTVQPQSSFCIIDNLTGQVKAIAGGRGEKLTNRGFNRAIDAYRSPGSVFKVLASYAPAFDTGLCTPATIIDDVPFQAGSYAPGNWTGKFIGLSTAREAVKDSMNICAVKTLQNVTVDTAMNYLFDFGFSSLSKDDYNLATALGGLTTGVNILELTAAFEIFPNQGNYTAPVFYTKVLDHEGNIILENIKTDKRVIKESTAYLLTDVMKDVIRAGTGGSAAFKNISMPLSGKTGTSQKDRDLTFVGFTPYYTAGIWLGYDVLTPMKNYGSVHTKLWSKIMEQVHIDLPRIEFEQPSSITSTSICMESGMLASELCELDPRGSRVRTEIFEKGTLPTEPCDVHIAFDLCIESNLNRTEFCPVESVQRVVGIKRHVPVDPPDRPKVVDCEYEFSDEVYAGVLCSIHTQNLMPEETELPFDPTIPTASPATQNPSDFPVTPATLPPGYDPISGGSIPTPMITPSSEPTQVPYTEAPPEVTERP